MKDGNPQHGGGVPPPRSGNALTGEGTRPPPGNDESTGLPGLRRWRTVYWVVLGIFALWVVLLTVLTKTYS
jgi:hypothetical protein